MYTQHIYFQVFWMATGVCWNSGRYSAARLLLRLGWPVLRRQR